MRFVGMIAALALAAAPQASWAQSAPVQPSAPVHPSVAPSNSAPVTPESMPPSPSPPVHSGAPVTSLQGMAPVHSSSTTTSAPNSPQANAEIARTIYHDCNGPALKTTDAGGVVMCMGARAVRACGADAGCRTAVRALVRREFNL